mmetsp:Transcript_18673/g.72039  ORF Transcript_18673/g.72039 Transcript_18673/m.72039 type:complete len:241 (+) Transcript_18673:269-991(+)
MFRCSIGGGGVVSFREHSCRGCAGHCRRAARVGVANSTIRHNHSLYDIIQVGEVLAQIGVSLRLDEWLKRVLSVARVDGLNYVPACHDNSKRREAHAVEIGVVVVVDVQLGGAGVRARGRERHPPLGVALNHWVVRDGVVPLRVDCRVPVDAPLYYKVLHDAEEAIAVVKRCVGLEQSVEPVYTMRGPLPTHVDLKTPRGRVGAVRRVVVVAVECYCCRKEHGELLRCVEVGIGRSESDQ